MIDLFIGIVATLASTIIIGLFGLLVNTPYKVHQEIFKRILRLIRNYEDPRTYQGQLLPHSFIVKCIEKQVNDIEEINSLIDEQKDLNPLLYKLFKYDEVKRCINVLFHYISDPIALEESKEFDVEYRLDSQKLFKELKQRSRFPWLKFVIIISILLLLFISILVLAFKIATNNNTMY